MHESHIIEKVISEESLVFLKESIQDVPPQDQQRYYPYYPVVRAIKLRYKEVFCRRASEICGTAFEVATVFDEGTKVTKVHVDLGLKDRVQPRLIWLNCPYL